MYARADVGSRVEPCCSIHQSTPVCCSSVSGREAEEERRAMQREGRRAESWRLGALPSSADLIAWSGVLVWATVGVPHTMPPSERGVTLWGHKAARRLNRREA